MSDEALLLLLLSREDTDGDTGTRMSRGITEVSADDRLCLVFTAADLGRPTIPIRHSGGNTSLTNVHIINNIIGK